MDICLSLRSQKTLSSVPQQLIECGLCDIKRVQNQDLYFLFNFHILNLCTMSKYHLFHDSFKTVGIPPSPPSFPSLLFSPSAFPHFFPFPFFLNYFSDIFIHLTVTNLSFLYLRSSYSK